MVQCRQIIQLAELLVSMQREPVRALLVVRWRGLHWCTTLGYCGMARCTTQFCPRCSRSVGSCCPKIPLCSSSSTLEFSVWSQVLATTVLTCDPGRQRLASAAPWRMVSTVGAPSAKRQLLGGGWSCRSTSGRGRPRRGRTVEEVQQVVHAHVAEISRRS